MQKKLFWWTVVIMFGTGLYTFTASPVSNNVHSLLLLERLNFLSIPELSWFNIIVRKGAHLLTYGVLALLTQKALTPNHRAAWYAWLLATSAGAGDEIHQILIPGRTPLFSDIMLDSLGAALGLWLVAWITMRHKDNYLGTTAVRDDNLD